MKRSGPPARRTPLRSGKPLAPGAGLRTSRKPLRARNPERRPADAEAEVRERVFTRDRWRCQLEPERSVPSRRACSGPLTPHHRRKAGSGGAYTDDNLVALCAGHNTDVEDEPDWYRATFGTWLVVREGDPEWHQLGKRAQRG